MTDTLLGLVPAWGPALLVLATFLSCLALPIPASLLMLAAGAFSAGGDLSLSASAGGAFVGAMLGDQTGFLLGRQSSGLLARVGRGSTARRQLIERARDFVAARGTVGVFLSRWLVSPLGPYVNLIGGATGLGWTGFTVAGALGEAVWVSVYVGSGWIFADRIDSLSGLAGNISGALTAGAVAVVLGYLLLRAVKRERRRGGRHLRG